MGWPPGIGMPSTNQPIGMPLGPPGFPYPTPVTTTVVIGSAISRYFFRSLRIFAM
jgi:hypothetical protein